MGPVGDFLDSDDDHPTRDTIIMEVENIENCCN